jgi:phthiocerol/phenolphthiocerol synthesis type-I polyketide synthase E
MTIHDNGLRPDLEIAVVGMAARFPGAPTVDDFWRNLCGGVESITTFTEEELAKFGVNSSVYKNPDFVKASPVLESIDEFDAEFFGYSPREAELMDPQHRLFLECAWAALENAGYRPDKTQLLTGVFAGSSLSSYLLYNILPNLSDPHAEDTFQAMIGNDKDFLCTRVSYKLNLHGPSISVQTGCSTSLVAIHLACQSLLSYQCDMALAGGVSVQVPARTGYLYQSGGLSSIDGHCRAFDAKAEGTLFGSGVGIVVLKRLDDALTNRDSISAVIKGSAVNNDGNGKVGYTAPGVAGQTSVIRSAHAHAEVDPSTIGYVECHGTATSLGDPIELQALTTSFGNRLSANNSCAIGSVKTNIGHLDAAAGVAGFLKTVLALKNKQIPPSLHFESPNPRIDFSNSPFHVNASLRPWERTNGARRAAVSSFGIGGTNSHIVLQEPSPFPEPSPTREYKAIVLSARTKSALEKQTAQLAEYLRAHDEKDLDFADVAFTTQTGRAAFEHRRSVTCRNREEAIQTLDSLNPQKIFSFAQKSFSRSVVFMFPGGGAQYVNMAAGLYGAEPEFRKELDRCVELLRPEMGADLRSYLYPETDSANSVFFMRQTSIGLPALFIVEYSMARLLMKWGIQPDAFIGHSLGEYTAACLAGVMSLQDALSLVLTRSKLLQKAPKGSMLSVPLSKDELSPMLNDKLWVAAINGPSQLVVSGTVEAIEEMAQRLEHEEIECRKIPIDVSSHSGIVEPILHPLRDFLETIELRPPQIPFISNLTGIWIRPDEATDPGYWVRHLRNTVRFSDGVVELCRVPNRVLLEVGPGHTLATLTRAQLPANSGAVVITSIRHPYEKKSDSEVMINTLGKLWAVGASPDWQAFHSNEARSRVPLPTYPFERKRYWIDASSRQQSPGLAKGFDTDQWFYIPEWKTSLPARSAVSIPNCLVFASEQSIGSALAERLRELGKTVITAQPGIDYKKLSDHAWQIDIANASHYGLLLRDLRNSGVVVETIVHAFNTNAYLRSAESNSGDDRQTSFYSVLYVAQAISEAGIAARLCVVADGLCSIEHSDHIVPERTLLAGLCKVIPQELENVRCKLIDIAAAYSLSDRSGIELLTEHLLQEISSAVTSPVVALRGNRRWIQDYERIDLRSTKYPNNLRDNGVYLITGGLGNVGLLLAEHLFQTKGARLVLTTRQSIPPATERGRWISEHAGNPLSAKLHKLLDLGAAGAEIMLLCADISDAAQISAVRAQARERFGAIDGVFHLAGRTGKDAVQLLATTTPPDTDEQFNAKLRGACAIHQVFGQDDLDFVLLFSSNASILGGMGLASYAAANSALDAIAQEFNGRGKTRWISVNWDRWGTEPIATGSISQLDAYAMTIPEALQALETLIASFPGGQVIVSTADLNARLRLWTPTGREKEEGKTPATDESATHSRPALDTEYAPPSDQVEDRIAGVWRELLGLDLVGRHDNFFELGGNSLIALKVASRLTKELGVKLPVVSLFEGPTVSALAKLVAAA